MKHGGTQFARSAARRKRILLFDAERPTRINSQSLLVLRAFIPKTMPHFPIGFLMPLEQCLAKLFLKARTRFDHGLEVFFVQRVDLGILAGDDRCITGFAG